MLHRVCRSRWFRRQSKLYAFSIESSKSCKSNLWNHRRTFRDWPSATRTISRLNPRCYWVQKRLFQVPTTQKISPPQPLSKYKTQSKSCDCRSQWQWQVNNRKSTSPILWLFQRKTANWRSRHKRIRCKIYTSANVIRTTRANLVQQHYFNEHWIRKRLKGITSLDKSGSDWCKRIWIHYRWGLQSKCGENRIAIELV